MALAGCGKGIGSGRRINSLVIDMYVDYAHICPMEANAGHTVAQLHTFSRAAKAAGMSPEDIEDLERYLSENPDAGDEIEGTGGCRKVRFSISGNNKGKRGGVRTITLFSGQDLPVFLITVFAKNQKVTLTKAERNGLRKLSDKVIEEYARRVLPLAAGDRQ